jgi:hypothetical protein
MQPGPVAMAAAVVVVVVVVVVVWGIERCSR